MSRQLRRINQDIVNDYQDRHIGIPYNAVPYIRAMRELVSIDDKYGAEDGRTIVLYLLSNLSTWKGPTARSVKAELNAILKGTK